MKTYAALSIALSLLAQTTARADPITDLPGWIQEFSQQALKGDANGMSALITKATAPGLDGASVTAALRAATTATASETAESAEQFNEIDVGNFIKRINVAVIYPHNYLFYSFALGHHASGWLIYNFRVDGNLNNILNAPWPG